MDTTPETVKTYLIDAASPETYGAASSDLKKILKQRGLGPDIIRRTTVSLYEAEINAIIHGGGGTGRAEIYSDRILLVLEDRGPGIPDIGLAMQEGFSTASEEAREMGFGAGLGLPNIRKNADRLHIDSEPGKGTTVTIEIHLKPKGNP